MEWSGLESRVDICQGGQNQNFIVLMGKHVKTCNISVNDKILPIIESSQALTVERATAKGLRLIIYNWGGGESSNLKVKVQDAQ